MDLPSRKAWLFREYRIFGVSQIGCVDVCDNSDLLVFVAYAMGPFLEQGRHVRPEGRTASAAGDILDRQIQVWTAGKRRRQESN
ncbi:hypothetical protein [Mesorhizobium sp. RIZ17]|uniref:hypothetical protein n=1 Tax=Mesorhizobium sp. RIZ17 TaxID=3132743 RepID=UPI003DAA4342